CTVATRSGRFSPGRGGGGGTGGGTTARGSAAGSGGAGDAGPRGSLDGPDGGGRSSVPRERASFGVVTAPTRACASRSPELPPFAVFSRGGHLSLCGGEDGSTGGGGADAARALGLTASSTP